MERLSTGLSKRLSLLGQQSDNEGKGSKPTGKEARLKGFPLSH